MSGYSFMVWWRKDNGKTYADPYTFVSLDEAQEAWARWRRELPSWPEDVSACGLTQIRWPAGRPGPRAGTAGDEPSLVRSPETSSEVAA